MVKIQNTIEDRISYYTDKYIEAGKFMYYGVFTGSSAAVTLLLRSIDKNMMTWGDICLLLISIIFFILAIFFVLIHAFRTRQFANHEILKCIDERDKTNHSSQNECNITARSLNTFERVYIFFFMVAVISTIFFYIALYLCVST